MNTEEKILEMLTEIKTTQEQQGELLKRQGELLERQGKLLDQHDRTLSELQKTVTRVALTQENIVLKGLDALAEGQSLTHQRLKDLVKKDELAELRDEVRLMRTVVAQHSRDIEELKAAK